MADGWTSWEYDGLPSGLPGGEDVVGWVTLDTETSALSPDDGGVSVVSVAWFDSVGRAWHAAWAFAQGRYGKPEDDGKRSLFDSENDDAADGMVNLDRAEWEELLEWLEQVGLGLDMHNAKFDLGHMRQGVMLRTALADEDRRGGWAGVDLEARLGLDTALAAKECWPGEEVALKPLATRKWGEDASAEQRALKPYLGPQTDPRYDLVPWYIIKPYAAKDAILTLRLAALERELLEQGQGRWAAVRREQGVSMALYQMEWAGVPYPAKASRLVAETLEARTRVATAALPFKVKEAPVYFFGRDARTGRATPVKDSRGEWHDGLGLPAYGYTPTGRVQFTADTLEQMRLDEVPWTRELAEIKKAATASSMWYRGFADKTAGDARLRCMFRQVMNARGGEGGTASGRFSVERANLQAIPQDYRLTGELLAGLASPRKLIGRAAAELEGWQLWEYDLAQAELRVAAREAQCQTMLDMILAGDDLHGYTTTALFGLEAGDAKWKQFRNVGKRANFSLVFGSGWLTFQSMVRRECQVVLSNSEARRVVEEWRALYPEFARAIDKWSRVADRRGFIPLESGRPDGERRRWYKDGSDTHSAFNQRVQGSLAEYAKDWLLTTDSLCRELGLAQRGVREGVGRGGLCLVIHDSQVLLLPDELVVNVTARVQAAGEELWQQYWPGLPGGVDPGRWAA